ncbi:MAG TPA: hypothetical protein VFE58_19405 [Tepidisphaeraceae bacterium]|jgi:hypothetical protein|nr:hypothetical protein [Tepidisphaeraceae bacterium]
MRRSVLSLAAVAIAALFVSNQVQAAEVLLGTAAGGMMIHYNNIDNSGAGGVPDGIISGYDENPNNIAYITSQFSSTNSNGAAFSFNPALGLDTVFAQINPTQFALDLVYKASTYNPGPGVSAPTLNFKDNVDAHSADATTTPGGTTAFGIDDYLGTGGPGVSTNLNDNSIYRGTGVTFNIDNLTKIGTVYTLTISGTLTTDGSTHWYTVGVPDTTLASQGLTNVFNYTGVLTYDSAGDTGASQTDFYAGSVSIFANTLPAVPLPSAAWLGLALIGSLAAKRSLSSLRKA